MRYFLCATILVFTCAVHAEIHNLRLARVVAFGVDVDESLPELVFDSYLRNHEVRGSLTIFSDENYIIRDMRFDVWVRDSIDDILDEALLIDDSVVTVGYVPNGARYDVVSVIDGRSYPIRFIRRAPPGEGYDPAIIFLVRADPDLILQLDYRYVSVQ